MADVDSDIIGNLSMLVRRLAKALRDKAPDSDLPDKAMDYLKRINQSGNVLRIDSTQAKESDVDLGSILDELADKDNKSAGLDLINASSVSTVWPESEECLVIGGGRGLHSFQKDKSLTIVTQNISDIQPDVADQLRQQYEALPRVSPEFDKFGDPTDATLAIIENWKPDFESGNDPWIELIAYCQEAWNMDYGTIREERDEDGKRLWCFVTGGWSSNEIVQGAMQRNFMFHAMRWYSSSRGGLVKYM